MRLKNLKVLELASVLAGPQVGSFFAELGATVTKVENKTTGGDVTRKWKLPSEDSASKISAYYASTNHNKNILLIDYNDPKELNEVRQLIANTNIIIANFKAGAAQKFGLDYESVKKINPEIIYGEITGFGPTSKRTAYDVILQAETGYISMTGNSNDGMAKLPVAFIDLFAAHQLKEGLLVTLLEDRKPALVSVSLYDSAIASLVNQASNFLMENHIPQPIGTMHPNIAPYGDIFYTKDELPLLFAIGSNKQFETLLKILNLESSDEFDSNLKRVKNRDRINRILAPAVQKYTRHELLETCHKLAVPAGAVYNLEEVFEQPKSQKLILEEDFEGISSRKVKSVVFSISS
jgi:crotonobetainyl-CoA:carnitine CoA-transferase CaiB-like acyl-CoA transferase